MSDFFGAALSFPTVLFTPMLVVVVGFWAIVVGGGADPEAEHGGHVEPLGFLGLGGVPVSVPVSLLVLFAWFASLAGSQLTALPSWLVLIAALLSAWVLTRPAVLALRRLLPSGPDVSRADFIIVGGDSVFFDKLLGSITMGKALDGFVEHSTVAQAVGARYLDGSADLTETVVGSLSTSDLANVPLAAFLAQQIKSGGADAGKLEELLAAAKKMGLADSRVPVPCDQGSPGAGPGQRVPAMRARRSSRTAPGTATSYGSMCIRPCY